MKIKVTQNFVDAIRNHTYMTGRAYEVPDDRGGEFVRGNLAIEIKHEKPKAKPEAK